MYDRIWLLLMKHGMNKLDFSKKVGISSGNLSDWSTGRSNPSTKKIVKIADYFNVSTDWLLERDDRYPVANPEYKDLVQAYAKLDDQGKAVVLGTVYQQLQRCEGSKNTNREGNENDDHQA